MSFSRSVGVQYATGKKRINSSRRNEESGPKRKWHPVMDVSGGESKVQCCKEQYCIGTWHFRSVNQGTMDVVKQEMVRVNIDISGSYAILLFTASDLAPITSHTHNWVLFLFWLHPFILSGVISPLISSSILGTYWPEEFPFQYPIILPFHTVHGVLKARILKWFDIPFSSGPHSVRPLHHDPAVLGSPTWHGSASLS